MQSILRYTAAGLALATVGFASNASAATGSATASAEILSNLQITSNNTVLNFGTILAPTTLAANAPVTVSTAGVRNCDALLTCSGTTAAPTFTVTGFAGQSVSVTFPASSVQLDRGAALGTMERYMTVDTLTRSAATVNLVGGTGTFTIGGTLNVRPNQAPGVYTGSVQVQVEYN